MKYLITLAALLAGCKHYVPKTGVVTAVGGCDRGGVCGVSLDNGPTCTAYYPVVGQTATCWVEEAK